MQISMLMGTAEVCDEWNYSSKVSNDKASGLKYASI